MRRAAKTLSLGPAARERLARLYRARRQAGARPAAAYPAALAELLGASFFHEADAYADPEWPSTLFVLAPRAPGDWREPEALEALASLGLTDRLEELDPGYRLELEGQLAAEVLPELEARRLACLAERARARLREHGYNVDPLPVYHVDNEGYRIHDA